MKLLNSEAFGPLVKSSVEVEGKHIDVYHIDLPPDLTGIFDVAYRLATEPKVVEAKPVKIVDEPLVISEPVVIPKEKLDAAVEVAKKLNKLGVVEVAEPAGEIKAVKN